MSQFITTSGPHIEFIGFTNMKLIEAKNAQYYIENLENDLKKTDGDNVYLIDDCSSGTSDELFEEFDLSIRDEGTIRGTELYRALAYLYQHGHTIRIWVAQNSEKDHENVIECINFKSFVKTLELQDYGPYRARVTANK